MEELLRAKESEWTNPKHAEQWKMTLRTYAQPLHHLPVADIVMGDVKVLGPDVANPRKYEKFVR